MPTQMPSTGRPAATRSAITGPAPTASIPAMHAAYAPDARHDQTVGGAAAARSSVTVTSAPAAASARSADRRLPEP